MPHSRNEKVQWKRGGRTGIADGEILGGGVGGQVAANALRRLLPEEHRVVVIEREANHAFAPSFLWLMTGDRKPAQIVRPLQSLLRPGVELVTSQARRIDLGRGRVETGLGEVAYDHLVVALGAELAPEAIPGLADAAQTFYTFEGASRLHEALRSFQGGRIAVVVCSLPYKCPGAPHEGAMLIADTLRRRGLVGKFEPHLFTPEPQPLPVAGPVLGGMVAELLAQKGIQFHPGRALASVDGAGRRLEFKDGTLENFDLVAIPPHRPPAVVRESGLGNEAGWIPVDRSSLATLHERVHAIGDVTAITLPGRWRPDVPLPLPKAGVFAHAQALAVAQRIAHRITGAGKPEVFCAGGYCMLEAGEEMAGFAYGDFYAEPSPRVELRNVGRTWHLGKVLFEKWWLAPVGPRRNLLRLALLAGGRAWGVKMEL
jgi:sulfide:quinone oxidoreductase